MRLGRVGGRFGQFPVLDKAHVYDEGDAATDLLQLCLRLPNAEPHRFQQVR